jgi:hypothetical protein
MMLVNMMHAYRVREWLQVVSAVPPRIVYRYMTIRT